MEEKKRPVQLSDMIASGKKYSLRLTEVIHALPMDEYCCGQGAASDGTYAYFVLRTRQDGYARIAKYVLATGEFVAASEPVYVLHGNDMTYCRSKNVLYLIHGSKEGKIVTTMNPETLTVIEQTVNLPAGAGAMSYSWEKDKFVFSQGGKSFYVADTDFNLEVSAARTPTPGYTAQGVGSDDTFVYFPMSGPEDNIFMTYDWQGNYVTDVHIPSPVESESMYWINDTYYINFNNHSTGAYLCRLDVIPEE